MKMFTQEEIALMSGYECSNLAKIMEQLREALPYMEDLESADLMYGCLVKLQAMTEEEFKALREELTMPELF